MSKKSPFLDSYKNNRNKFCGKFTIKGQVESEKYGKVWRYARLNCKSWQCPRCGPKRVKMLRHAIIRVANEFELRRFLTLTLDPRSCTPEESVKYARKCWNKMRTYLRREFGEPITFIAILEFQKSGYAHLHILIDRYIRHSWIQKNWQAVGGGKFVNIRQVNIRRISAYLSKYLTKELLLAPYYQQYRRYTTSRDIKLFIKAEKGLWTLFRSPLEYLLALAPKNVIEIGASPEGFQEWFNILEPL